MTETGSTVERLRWWIENTSPVIFPFSTPPFELGEARVLLAVVEAAQDFLDDYDDGVEDENHPELSKALADLHSQASDEGSDG